MADKFGLPEVPLEENTEFDFLGATPTSPETPEAPASPEEPAEPTPAEPSAEATPAETPPAEEAPLTEPEKLYLGKYKSPEDLEKGYRELRDLQRRTAERAKAYEDDATKIREHAQLLESTLQRALPYLQQVQAQQAQRQQDPYAALETPALTPDQVTVLADQIVAQRMAAMQQQLTDQREADAAVQEAEKSIMDFYARHPEVEVRGDIDSDIAETVTALNESWAQSGSSLDISDPSSLDIAYEATKRPALRKVLELMPEFIDTDEGMELARFQASVLEGQTTQTTTSVPSSQVETVTTRKPVIEKASTANPQEPGRPLDEFEQAVVDYRKERRRDGSSVFFS